MLRRLASFATNFAKELIRKVVETNRSINEDHYNDTHKTGRVQKYLCSGSPLRCIGCTNTARAEAVNDNEHGIETAACSFSIGVVLACLVISRTTRPIMSIRDETRRHNKPQRPTSRQHVLLS